MAWLFGGSSQSQKPAPAPKPPECPPGGNLNLIPKLRHSDVSYSGFLFQLGEGWMGTHHSRVWAELRGPQESRVICLRTDPADPAGARELGVKGAAVAAVPNTSSEDIFEFSVTSTVGGYEEHFFCSSDEERAQWIARVSIAVLQADVNLPLPHAAEVCAEWVRVVTAAPRGCVPKIDPAEAPEKQFPTTLSGYVTCRHDSESLLGAMFGFGGADWKRRWVTVHGCFATIRDDKPSVVGCKVIPLRDTTAEWGAISGHPWSFLLSGAFIPDVTLSFADKETYTKWRTAVMHAARNNTPNVSASDDVAAAVQAEVGEIEQEQELAGEGGG